MKNLILVQNIDEQGFSIYNVREFVNASIELGMITDLVLFLPCMGSTTEDVLMTLIRDLNMINPDFNTDVFLDEEDFGNISFEFINSLHDFNPNFHIHSKDDQVYIGENSFKWFSLDEYVNDELDYLFSEVHSEKENNLSIKKHFVVNSYKDEEFLKSISKKYSCISKGEYKVISRYYSRDYIYRRLSLSGLKEDNNIKCISNKNVDEKVSVLKKVPLNNNKKGNK